MNRYEFRQFWQMYFIGNAMGFMEVHEHVLIWCIHERYLLKMHGLFSIHDYGKIMRNDLENHMVIFLIFNGAFGHGFWFICWTIYACIMSSKLFDLEYKLVLCLIYIMVPLVMAFGSFVEHIMHALWAASYHAHLVMILA